MGRIDGLTVPRGASVKGTPAPELDRILEGTTKATLHGKGRQATPESIVGNIIHKKR